MHPSGYANAGSFALVVMSKLDEDFVLKIFSDEQRFKQIKDLAYKHYDERKTAEESATEIKGIGHNETDKGLGLQSTSEGYNSDQEQHNRDTRRQRSFKKNPDSGHPDYHVIYHLAGIPITLFFEIKSPSGKVSDLQKSGTKPSTKEVSEPSLSGTYKTQKTPYSKSKKSFSHIAFSYLGITRRNMRGGAKVEKGKGTPERDLTSVTTKEAKIVSGSKQKLAEEIVEVLNKHLPQNLRATVVRDTEVNIYDFLVYDFEEYERQIERSNRNFVREFAKSKYLTFKKELTDLERMTLTKGGKTKASNL